MKAKHELSAHRVTESFANVWLLTGDDGRCKVEGFLSGLEKKHFIKLLVTMKRVDANTAYRHPERFKQLDGPVFEFKSHLHRLFCFRAERGFVCTDGIKKQKSARTKASDNAVENAAKLAEQFAKEGKYVD